MKCSVIIQWADSATDPPVSLYVKKDISCETTAPLHCSVEQRDAGMIHNPLVKVRRVGISVVLVFLKLLFLYIFSSFNFSNFFCNFVMLLSFLFVVVNITA